MRLELEDKYKTNIENNEIFLFRLSKTFFEFNDESERYKDKKHVFSYILIIIIIISMLSIKDFNEFVFRRNKINITKINKKNRRCFIRRCDCFNH